jgi:hypothetical protein
MRTYGLITRHGHGSGKKWVDFAIPNASALDAGLSFPGLRLFRANVFPVENYAVSLFHLHKYQVKVGLPIERRHAARCSRRGRVKHRIREPYREMRATPVKLAQSSTSQGPRGPVKFRF